MPAVAVEGVAVEEGEAGEGEESAMGVEELSIISVFEALLLRAILVILRG